MDKATHAYIARDEYGVFAAMVDMPSLKKETAKEIARWVRGGATVERVPIEQARVSLSEYVAARKQREAEAEALATAQGELVLGVEQGGGK